MTVYRIIVKASIEEVSKKFNRAGFNAQRVDNKTTRVAVCDHAFVPLKCRMNDNDLLSFVTNNRWEYLKDNTADDFGFPIVDETNPSYDKYVGTIKIAGIKSITETVVKV